MSAAPRDPNLAAGDFMAIPLSEPISPVVKAGKSYPKALLGPMSSPRRRSWPQATVFCILPFFSAKISRML